MSTASFAAEPRRSPRPGPRPGPGSGHPARPRLTLVPRRRMRPAKAPFVLLVLGLLATGLVALLVLNTMLAENALRRQQLQSESARLTQQEQALRQEVAVSSSPQWLAQMARKQGMVPSENPAFLDTRNGRVLGEPKPGTAASAGPATPR